MTINLTPTTAPPDVVERVREAQRLRHAEEDARIARELQLEANRRLGAPPLVARTQFEFARALLRTGMPGDRDRAHGMLSPATATASRLGMAPLLRDIDLLAAAR